VALSSFFGAMAAHDLGTRPPVSSDEVEIMAVSYKLATQGLLGSDLQAGFFHAEDHHFLTLPIEHVGQALSFRLFEPGVSQARAAGLTAAVALIWFVGWLAWRWYGLGAALIGEFLLVAWPSDLVPGSPGLPLLTVGRTARYDVTAVAFVWLSVVLLDASLRRPRVLPALGAGLAAGLAALTQFFGFFALPLIALNCVGRPGRRAWTRPGSGWTLAAACLVLLPYAVYVGHFHDDLVGQWSVHLDRGIFGGPAFYLNNLLEEPARFAHLGNLALPGLRHPDLVNRPLSPWLLVLIAPVALVWLGYRTWRRREQGDRLLLSSLLVSQGLLALLDVTKAPLYAILLVPPVCLTLAAFTMALLDRLVRRAPDMVVRIVAVGTAVGLLAIVAVEGASAYWTDATPATQTSGYMEVGERMEHSLPGDARLLGPERWWWPLHDHPYLALRNVWRQWDLAAAASERTPLFADWVAGAQTDFVVLNEDVRQDLTVFPEALQGQFWSFVDACTDPWADWADPTYGDIQLRHVVWVDACLEQSRWYCLASASMCSAVPPVVTSTTRPRMLAMRHC
jgi:hypothetical protein